MLIVMLPGMVSWNTHLFVRIYDGQVCATRAK